MAMAIFIVRNDVAELEALRKSLGNSLQLQIKIETETTRDYEDLFVELLTSPDSQVSKIRLNTTCGNISPVVKLLLHPDNQIESLRYDGRTGLSSDSALSLASILKQPGTKLRSLVLKGHTLESKAAFEPIASALQHPHNRLQELSLKLSPDNDLITDMASVIRSEYFKVTTLSLRSASRLRESTLKVIIEALVTKPLKSLHLFVPCYDRSTSPVCAVLADMIHLPGSTLEVLRLEVELLPEEIASVLEALQSNHNKLHTFDYKQNGRASSHKFLESFSNGVTKALSSPNNRLTNLVLDLDRVSHRRPLGVKPSAALCEALEHPNCCLEQLSVSVSQGGLERFERLLKSPKNPLKRLEMNWNTYSHESMFRFLTAVRTSRLEGCYFPRAFRFCEAFESRWYRVFCTLLSMHDIPRLCSNQHPLPRLPMKNLILKIVETLGWPLDHLVIKAY